MAKVYERNLALSLDGYMAGPNQDVDNPLGVGGPGLHDWVFASHEPCSSESDELVRS
jgi:hypothetical protein